MRAGVHALLGLQREPPPLPLSLVARGRIPTSSHTLPSLPSETRLPQLDCGDDCGALLITNLVDLNFEVHIRVAVGEGVNTVVEYVALVVERAEAPLQIL